MMVEEDHCLYVKQSSGNNIYLIDDIKKWMPSNFDMKDMGEADYVHEVEILRDSSKKIFILSQKTYKRKIQECFWIKKKKITS